MESGATRCESFLIPVSETIEQSADWIWQWVVDWMLMREPVFLQQRSILMLLRGSVHFKPR